MVKSMKAVKTMRSNKSIARLNVIIGKSPGEALRKFQHMAYTLEAQKNQCISCFNRKYGRGGWKVSNWYTRDVSARVSKAWPPQLKAIISDTLNMDGILAAPSVCRMLRNARDFLTLT